MQQGLIPQDYLRLITAELVVAVWPAWGRTCMEIQNLPENSISTGPVTQLSIFLKDPPMRTHRATAANSPNWSLFITMEVPLSLVCLIHILSIGMNGFSSSPNQSINGKQISKALQSPISSFRDNVRATKRTRRPNPSHSYVGVWAAAPELMRHPSDSRSMRRPLSAVCSTDHNGNLMPTGAQETRRNLEKHCC